MPRFLRVTLAPDEEEALRRRLRRTLGPWERLRLERVRLSHRGWTVPEIASHLEVHQATVREALRRFAGGGFDALPDGHRSGRPPTLTADVPAAVEALLDAAAERGEAWTVPRLPCGVGAVERLKHGPAARRPPGARLERLPRQLQLVPEERGDDAAHRRHL
ncbi:MAG TPA: helix-turn-helix domain-containing protein [Chloroflexota bacterium]|nr:helix-turn-helix domain-containing protein [Chloroflexota bacterium]